MNDFVFFESDKIIDTKIIYSNDYGKNPYILENKLFIPKEMLKEKYLINFQKNKEEYQNKNKEFIINNKEPTGLVNIGGICYLNSVLQCLFYCRPLTDYFLSLDEFSNLGLVSKGYYDFIKGLNSGNKYAAENLLKAIIATDNSFNGTEGKDSKDLFILILSQLHEELLDKNYYYINEKFSKIQFQEIKKKNYKTINNHDKLEVFIKAINSEREKKNNTIISDIFGYLILLENKCNYGKCNSPYSKTFFNIQNENIIIFELKNIIKKNSYQISLHDCLLDYSKIESLNCPYCKTNNLKIRKTICTLPKYFIFIMSRGKYAGLNCEIKVEKELDMKKYYTPIDDKYKEKNCIYDLLCGTLVFDWFRGYGHEGHTVALCKTYKYGQFYIFNDSLVRKSNINEFDRKTPYILIYERRDN